MRYIRHVGQIIVAIILLLALTLSCAPAVPEEPIKIACFLDYSGIGAGDLPWFEDGVRLKLDEVDWEVAGRPIELIAEDHGGDPVKGTEKAQKLVQVDKVDLVIGPVWANVQFAVAPIFAEAMTPQILPDGLAIGALELSAGNMFLLKGTDVLTGYYSGVYAAEDLGYRTAVILHDDFVAGEGLVAGFIRAFEDGGGTIVQTLKVPLFTFDFAPYMSTIKQADVVAFWVIPPEVPAFVKQYHEFGLEMPLISTYLQGTHETWAGAGDSIIGLIGQNDYSINIDTDLNRQFQQAYLEKYDEPATANHMHHGGYAAATFFLEAVEATKGDTTPEKIIEAMKEISVDTPGGKIAFSAEGIAVGDELILRVIKKDGLYDTEVIKTYPQVLRKAYWE